MSLKPKNWESFQHYKDRSPSWIKLHRGLLDDFAFSRLPVASRALAPLLWLLASEYEGGKITASEDEIAFRLHMTAHDLFEALVPLLEGGFIIKDNAVAKCEQDDSVLLAAGEQSACLEKEIQERERKKDAAPPAPPLPPMSDETEVYRRGKEILGASAGGMIKNLVKAKKGSIPHARAAIEIASTKENPREYIGAIISGTGPPDDARARGDAW